MTMRRMTVLASRSPRTIFLFCKMMAFLAQIGQHVVPAQRVWLVPQIFLRFLEIYLAGRADCSGRPRCSAIYLVKT